LFLGDLLAGFQLIDVEQAVDHALHSVGGSLGNFKDRF